MKKFLFVVVLYFNSCLLYGQSGWEADLRVTSEFYIQYTEVNVSMIVDLYYNGNLVSPDSNYEYNWWIMSPNSENPSWHSWTTNYGYNTQGTHTYQDSTEEYAGLFDVKCKVTIPGVGTITSDVIRIPWYSVIADQKKSNLVLFGTVKYWYKGDFKDNNGLGTIYFPRYDPPVFRNAAPGNISE